MSTHSPAERVASAQLLADDAIAHLIVIKQSLMVFEVNGTPEPLGEALARVMKLDDLVGGDLFRDIHFAERKVRRDSVNTPAH